MSPVISKPAHATGSANCSADGNMIDYQSQCDNDGINENESNHFLDPSSVQFSYISSLCGLNTKIQRLKYRVQF